MFASTTGKIYQGRSCLAHGVLTQIYSNMLVLISLSTTGNTLQYGTIYSSFVQLVKMHCRLTLLVAGDVLVKSPQQSSYLS